MMKISNEQVQEIIAKGMIPWSGQKGRPADYDGGTVMFRDGTTGEESGCTFSRAQWTWEDEENPIGSAWDDIIAYTSINDVKVVVNEKSYAAVGNYTPQRQVTYVVEAITDMVPGAFHDPEDLMRWIATNPYVRLVKMETSEK